MGETMNKKLIKRYILLCIPFICGTLLYGIGFYGIVSSLLFFGGGYVVVKNIFDYRMVNKNIKKCIEKDLKIDNNDNIDILLLDENKVESKNILCNDIDVNNKSTPCEVPNRILASGFFNSSAQQIINCQDDNITYSIVFSTTVESANVLILFII